MEAKSSVLASKLESIAPEFKNQNLLSTLGLILATILLLFLVVSDPRAYKVFSFKKTHQHRHCSEGSYNSSAICTDGCRIPLLILDKESIQKVMIREHYNLNVFRPCRANPLLGSNKTHIWIEKKNLPYYNLHRSSKFMCCYRSFYSQILGSPIYDQIKYSDCLEFNDTISVVDEFVRVTCSSSKILYETEAIFDSFYIFSVEKEASNVKDLPYNVLVLGIDAVSRLNFHRTMPKTVEYLKRLYAVELLGYNKVGSNTFPNLFTLLTGLEHTQIESAYHGWREINNWTLERYPFIWKKFQQAGFVTAFAEDNAQMGTFNNRERGLQNVPTNYFPERFINEATYQADNNEQLTLLKFCMNEKFFFQLLLDYVEDLTKLKNKLFGIFWESTMSHDFLLFPTVMDDSYSEFLKRLHASGYLNDTVIFLISDHGIRYGAFRQSKQGFLEERLPFVFALMPPSFRENFTEAYKNLKLNSGRLTTPFDMHATLVDLVDLENIKNDKILQRSGKTQLGRSISLFLPISGQRTCRSAGVEDQWCACYRNTELKLNNHLANRAIWYAITHLNGLLENYPQCAKLSFAKTLEIAQLLPDEIEDGSIELFVVFQTMPGSGVFEAMLEGRNWSGPWSVSGHVSRLNFQGNQSHCVSNPQLALYCYCDNLIKDSPDPK